MPPQETAIIHIVEMIGNGEWKTGISERELAQLWGRSPAFVAGLYRTAVMSARLTVHPSLVSAAYLEGLSTALRVMNEAEANKDFRAALMGSKIVTDSALSVLTSKDSPLLSKGSTNAKGAYEMLVRSGWTPPSQGLAGLPAPAVMPKITEEKEKELNGKSEPESGDSRAAINGKNKASQ